MHSSCTYSYKYRHTYTLIHTIHTHTFTHTQVSDSRAEEAEIQLLRQTHLVNKLIEKVPDDLTYENDDKHTQSARYYDESNVRRTQFADPARFYVHRFDDSAN